MQAVDVVSGAVRDVVRYGVVAGLRMRDRDVGRLMDPAVVVDPYPMYRWVREQGEVLRTSLSVDSASYAFCDRLMRHPRVETANGRLTELFDDALPLMRWMFGYPRRPGLIQPIGPESLIGMDGAGHARLRRLVGPWFTRSGVERWRPRLTEIAHELLDDALRGDSFDLMNDYAGVLPVRAITELLGNSDVDIDRFRVHGAALAEDLDALVPAHRQRAATRAIEELNTYFAGLIERKRREPGPDLLSELLQDTAGQEPLTERELTAMCLLLLFAGFETTVNLIGNGAMALVQHPDQLALLREDPALLPGAIEEMLRWDAPVQMISRIPAEDIEIGGTSLAAGTAVSAMLGGANRDPAVFADPDRFDITRENARRHLSFASGPHHCLGAALARLEAEVAFSVLLERLGDLRLAGTPRRRRTFILRGYREIPLVVTAH